MGKFSSLIRTAAGKERFCSAVILAAGSGTRFGGDVAKQFIKICGITALERSVKVFQDSELFHEIIVVTQKNDITECRKLLSSVGMTKVTRVVEGGTTRQESAMRGFEAVNPACSFVAIHDAARCLLTAEMLEAVTETAFVSGAAAAATRAVDTVKRTNGADIVAETLPRDNIWLVQTPQIFSADIYRASAYLAVKNGTNATDDCALCEAQGFKVTMVECGRTNIKITYPEDLIYADAVIKSRENKDTAADSAGGVK